MSRTASDYFLGLPKKTGLSGKERLEAVAAASLLEAIASEGNGEGVAELAELIRLVIRVDCGDFDTDVAKIDIARRLNNMSLLIGGH